MSAARKVAGGSKTEVVGQAETKAVVVQRDGTPNVHVVVTDGSGASKGLVLRPAAARRLAKVLLEAADAIRPSTKDGAARG